MSTEQDGATKKNGREQDGEFGPLLDRAQNGDDSALGELLEDNREWLKRNAARSVGAKYARRQDASDLTQECLTAASRQIEDFQGENLSTFRGWLRAIQRNLIRKLVRSESYKVQHECDLPQTTSGGLLLDDGQTPLMTKVENRESVSYLMLAIEQLNPDDRKLIERKFFADGANVSYDELAEEFDVTAATLRKRLSRLLKKLEMGIRLLKQIQRCRLPELQARLLCLQHFKGRKLKEISQEMGTTEDAIRSLLEQAERELATFGDPIA